eukprot:7851530-Lingulodinium_polyedra.AAC.1
METKVQSCSSLGCRSLAAAAHPGTKGLHSTTCQGAGQRTATPPWGPPRGPGLARHCTTDV